MDDPNKWEADLNEMPWKFASNEDAKACAIWANGYASLLDSANNDVQRLNAYIDTLEALRKDAERYRWLRDSQNAYPLFFIAQRDPNNLVVQFKGELADANIDEMIRLDKPK